MKNIYKIGELIICCLCFLIVKGGKKTDQQKWSTKRDFFDSLWSVWSNLYSAYGDFHGINFNFLILDFWYMGTLINSMWPVAVGFLFAYFMILSFGLEPGKKLGKENRKEKWKNINN